jgi:hypothetical protein
MLGRLLTRPKAYKTHIASAIITIILMMYLNDSKIKLSTIKAITTAITTIIIVEIGI